MTAKRTTSIFILILLVLAAATPLRADLLVVPGKRVGDISLGMERAEVLRLLGTPQREDVLANNDDTKNSYHCEPPHKVPVEKTPGGDEIRVFRDDWVTSVALKNATGFLGKFVSVYYLNRRVIQIEFCSAEFKTEDKLSTESVVPKFRKAYPHFITTHARSQIPGSVIYSNNRTVVEDAVDAGIAWIYGALGNLAEDTDETGSADVIVIHAAGKEMVFDPDNDCRFLWKDKPTGLSTDH